MPIYQKDKRNCIIAFPNIIDLCSLSGGSFKTALPITNLQNNNIHYYAQSSLKSDSFTINTQTIQKLKILVMVNHNLTADAKWRIKVSNVSDFSNILYDSGDIDVITAIMPYEALEWEDDTWWSGKPKDLVFTSNAIHILPDDLYGQYVSISISDELNSSTIKIGRLFLSPEWQPTFNMTYEGFEFNFQSLTEIERTISGKKYYNKKQGFRTNKLKLANMSENEAKAIVFEMYKKLDVYGELFFIPDPFSTEHIMRESYLANLKQLNAITYPYLNNYETSFEIEEIV